MPLGTAETHVAQQSPPPAAIDDDRRHVGRVIDDRYKVLRAIGHGGMGAVFLAEHLRLGNEVALKVIEPALAGHQELAARFAREAMVSAKLNHPHVVSALDYGELPDGGAFLVMQLARGESLGDWLERRGRLPWALACEIAAQIADAAAAAHQQGIIHRDLKPENVFVERRDDGSVSVQVLDFGIAKIAAEQGGDEGSATLGKPLTKLGTVMGTPGYMAPEQAMGQAADPRADLYALGVLLCEMITGELPYAGPSITDLVTAQLTHPPPEIVPPEDDPTYPEELNELVKSLLASAPEERPGSATEVRDHLRALVALAAAGPPLTPRPTAGEAFEPRVGHRNAVAVHPALARAFGFLRDAPPARLAVIVLGVVAVVVGLMAVSGDDAGDAATSPSSVASDRLPAELRDAMATLATAEQRQERREAAEVLLAHRPKDEVPEHALLGAELETARGCREREALVQQIAESGDPRGLPYLRHLDETPARGCGLLRNRDCLACVRSELREAIATLGGEAGGE